MTHPLSQQLRRLASFKSRSAAGKLLRDPVRMIWSQALESLSRRVCGPMRVRTRTFWGQKMLLVLPDEVSVSLHRYRFFEEGLSAIFLEKVHPKMTVFDIGAHFGYFSLLALHLVGNGGQVHAFEPTPRTFEILGENTAGHPNIRLNRNAVFSRRQMMTFTDYGVELTAYNSLGAPNLAEEDARRAGAQRYDVEAIAIDDYVSATGAQPDFIKIDAEGAEIPIIEGMRQTIAQRHPMITVEVGDIAAGEGPRSRKLLELLMGLGYEPWEFDDGSQSLRRHQLLERYPYDNILLAPA